MRPQSLCAAGALILSANAAPVPSPELGLLSGVLGLTTGIVGALTGTLATLLNPQPKTTPQNVEDVSTYLQQRYQNKPLDLGYISHALDYQSHGLVQSRLAGSTLNSSPAGINTFKSSNPKAPGTLYPKANSSDPDYTIPEDDLRAAIYIPSTFDAANAPNPVLLVPGTATFGGANFNSNIVKVLKADPSIGQAVWLNVPGAQLGDLQDNIEYVAYAINYLSSITGSKKVNVIGWSQGNFDSQWVMKYWTSCRGNTKQLISISADFHGTSLANLLDLPANLGLVPMVPSFLQQQYNTNLVQTLRRNDGDSAYVPTTSFYSSVFDEVVQPQSGTGASAYLKDVRGVGVSNIEIQDICGIGTPAGTLGTHESLLYNGLVLTLAVDALRHGGPAQTSRIDLEQACQHAVYPGLDLADVLETEATIPTAAINIVEGILNGMGLYKEPAIRSYAV